MVLPVSDAAVHQLTPGYNFNGRYYVSRCIGAGGMGSVYEAVHSETHGKVALKVMLPRLVHRDDMRRRFMQEAQVTAKIQSDHIVRVFDAGVDEATGMPFIVMELLVGEDLDALLSRAQRLEAVTVITLLKQAALALDKTHGAGIVHRDLKPHNLFVTRRDDGSPCVKILDFGIAKLIDNTGGSQRTRSAGTPVYMPPEQVRGEGDIGAPADAYALAHIAYTCIVGRPYWETEALELGLGPFIERIFAGPTEAPSVRAAQQGVHLPPGFDAWFMRAAATDKNARLLPTTQMMEQLAMVYGVSASGMASVPLPSAPPAQPAQPVAPITPAGATTGAIVAETSPPAGGTKPVWFLVGALVVLASVAVGALITYRFVASEDRVVAERDGDDDGDSKSKSKKKKRKKKSKQPQIPCPMERCVEIDFDKTKPINVRKWLKTATKLTREMEPKAELVMISLSETVKGKVAKDAQSSIVYIYRYPRPGAPGEFAGLTTVVTDTWLMAKRSQDVGLPVISPPECKLQKALKTAWADGLDRERRTTITFQLTPGTSSPHWMFAQTGKNLALRYVHGVTCQAYQPF